MFLGNVEGIYIILPLISSKIQAVGLDSLSAWRPSEYPSFIYFCQSLYSFGHAKIIHLLRGLGFTMPNNDTAYHPLRHNLVLPSINSISSSIPKTPVTTEYGIMPHFVIAAATALRTNAKRNSLPLVGAIVTHDACYIAGGIVYTRSGFIIGLKNGAVRYDPENQLSMLL